MSISSVTGTTAPSAASAAAPNGALGKDAFLKLLVAQLSHQDPLAPMDGAQMITQLAQFSALEQAVAQSERLDLLSAQLTGISNSEATGLVGKVVTVRGKQIAFDGVAPTGLGVTLSGPAAECTATIRDAAGKVVRTIDLGARPAGAVNVAWDGKDDAGNKLPAGAYTCDVAAKDAAGAAVTVSHDVTGTVVRVSFEKGYPELILDSGATAPVSDLVSVGPGPAKP